MPVGDILSGVGSVVGGVANAFASYYGARQNALMQKETNKLNAEMFKRQMAFQLDEANRQQSNWEANRPEHMVAEYRAAGLNPALAQGQMSSAAGGTSSPLSAPSAPKLDAPRPGDAFIGLGNAFVTAANGFQQIIAGATDNAERMATLKSRISKQLEEAKQAHINTDTLQQQNRQIEETFQTQMANLRQKTNEAEVHARLMQSQQYNLDYVRANVLPAQVHLTDVQASKLQQDMNNSIQQLALNRRLVNAQVLELYAKRDLERAHISIDRDAVNAMKALYASQAGLNDAQAGLADANKRYTNSKNAGQKIDNEVNRDTKGVQKVQRYLNAGKTGAEIVESGTRSTKNIIQSVLPW